ncbi:MAG: cupin domain-containing protein [Spirochaetota bacterium]
MKVTVEKINEADLKKQGVFSWPIWQKEISDFDWYYDTTEQFYVLEGEVEVETEDGQKIVFGAGDFVTFPQGVKCRWHVKKPIRKHYNFK